MNKAFTRETDDADDDDVPEGAPLLPAGTRNYMTPGGFARLKGELDHLVGKERPELVATDLVGGGQRRPLGERRLHLRQEAPARGRPPHPLSRAGGSIAPRSSIRRRAPATTTRTASSSAPPSTSSTARARSAR